MAKITNDTKFAYSEMRDLYDQLNVFVRPGFTGEMKIKFVGGKWKEVDTHKESEHPNA